MDYVPVFIANNFYKNRTEFKREHVVYNTFTKFPKVDRYINTGKLLRHRNNLLVHMPFERHTKRRRVEVTCQYDKEKLEQVLKKRWNPYENRPLRDVSEMCAVARRVVNSDFSRLMMVRSMLVEHPRLIIFYNFNYELEALRDLSVDTTIAEWNGHKHQPVPMGDAWVYLVQYTAGAEGWNCVETNAEIMYSLNYSWKITEQAEGRIDRLNTPFQDLWYYKFTSDSWIDKAIERSLQAKETFNELKLSSLFSG